MMIEMQYVRNEQGVPVIQCADEFKLLRMLLLDDVQSPQHCHELLERCDAVEKGEVSMYEHVGNSCSATVSKAEVVIEHLFLVGEDECNVDVQDFLDALRWWKNTLEQGQ